MPGPQFGQFHVRSRFSFRFTVPHTLQVLLLENRMGARITLVCRQWPLASSSRAGSPYPRHLARVLDFPVSAHPRQERGGARLSQHGVTAPGDDVGYVDLEGNHQIGDQDSFPPKAGFRASFTIPVRNGQTRPVTEHRPPAWGQQVLRSKFFKVITGFKFLAPCIANRASKSVTGRISRYRCRRCRSVMLPREPRWRHDDSGVKPEALVNQPPLPTHPALGRRLDQDDPGVRAPVICRTGVPGRSAQGTVCRSRSGIPGRSCYWGTMTEPRWPQREAGTPVDPLPPDPAHPGFGLRAWSGSSG